MCVFAAAPIGAAAASSAAAASTAMGVGATAAAITVPAATTAASTGIWATMLAHPFLAASAALTAMSGLTSAMGAARAGKAQGNAYDYAAAAAAQEAALRERTANQNVTLVQDEASQATKRLKRDVSVLEGEQKGLLAAQGIGSGSVTSSDITRATYDAAKLDEYAIRYNADSKSWGIKTNNAYEVWDLGNQANQYRIAGANARTAGNYNAASSILSTIGQVASSASMFRKIGYF